MLRKILWRNSNEVVLIACCAVLLPLVSWGLHAQTTIKGESFEVASVRKNVSGEPAGRMQIQPGGRFNADGATVRQIIVRAYGIQDRQLVGGPSWTNSDRFDITARANGDLTPEWLSAMLKNLLFDRFRLSVHPESRDLTIYALVLDRKDGKLGPQLRQSNVDCDKIAEETMARGGAPPPMKAGEAPPCSIGFTGGGRMAARSKPIAQLLTFFSQVTQRTGVDRTGLTGTYDVDLSWSPAASLSSIPENSPADSNGPSIFTAAQEQLGLKLQSQKQPLEVLAIDRIEQPTEN
jgi:uncharacterized protein (TIGR03435 family)